MKTEPRLFHDIPVEGEVKALRGADLREQAKEIEAVVRQNAFAKRFSLLADQLENPFGLARLLAEKSLRVTLRALRGGSWLLIVHAKGAQCSA